MIVTLHDKSVIEDSSVVHLRGEDKQTGAVVEVKLAGRAAVASAFESGVNYELTIAKAANAP